MKQLVWLYFSFSCFCLLASPPTSGSSKPPEWNPNGDTIYRLFRLSEPILDRSETIAAARLNRELSDLMKTTQGLEISDEEKAARLAVMRQAQNVLSDPLYGFLAHLFIVFTREKKLTISPDIKFLPASVPFFQPYIDAVSTSKTSDAALKKSGLLQLAYLYQFKQGEETDPNVRSSDILPLAKRYDAFLSPKGVSGFFSAAEHSLPNDSQGGIGTLIREHLRTARVAYPLGITCGLLLASFGNWGYEAFTSQKAETRLHTLQQKNEPDPIAEADEAAQRLGRSFGEFPPPPEEH